MKKIRLHVGTDVFIIEDCEGEPELRNENAAKCTAHRRVTAYPFEGEGAKLAVELRVEAVQ